MLELAEDVIQNELKGDEDLLWCGKPKQGMLIRQSDYYLIPFSIMWGGFAIFWEVQVIKGGAPFFFALFGVPFVVMGLYFMFGRFLVDGQLRQKTYYGVTDRRVIIISGLSQRRTKSLELTLITDLSFSEKADGEGTIYFGQRNPFYYMYEAMPMPGMDQYHTPKFELIANARDVYDLIVEAKSRG